MRILGRIGRAVSVIGLGTWQLGADWGPVSESDALAVLDAAAEAELGAIEDIYDRRFRAQIHDRW
jgi:aryl-alcohol dehydrogenase-like predicted oxidoreductase